MTYEEDVEYLTDEEEETLIRLLHKILTPDAWWKIEQCSDKTAYKSSGVVAVALSTTDWNRLSDVLRQVELDTAMSEAEQVLRPESEGPDAV